MTTPSSCGWEALRGDPLSWLLDDSKPNLHWRVLTELVGRPPDSPAVRRAQGGGSATPPVAALLADLQPGGTWSSGETRWARYRGSAWRMIAAVQWGADPSDPRLKAAAEQLLETPLEAGGVGGRKGHQPPPLATARLVQAVADLGYGRHLGVQEALAWFEEDGGAWEGPQGARLATAVALLAALRSAGEMRRTRLVRRIIEEMLGHGELASRSRFELGHPNLARTDLSEALWALALAEIPYEPRMRKALGRLQSAQIEGGRWEVGRSVPRSLPVDAASRVRVGDPSPWITLRGVVAMNAYAVDAGLPRLFPERSR